MIHTSTKQKEKIWVLLVVLYGIGKAVVVWKTIGSYGVNPFIYLIIDIIAAIPYGIATARVVIHGIARDWKQVQKWGLVAFITHFIPDIYIFSAARELPHFLFNGLIFIITFFSLFAVISLVYNVRKGK